MDLHREHDFSYQLGAGQVDSTAGILLSVTVAKSGVQATGKFVCLDTRGNITNDPRLAVDRIPIFTDEKTLTTLLGAAQDAKGRVKVRSDHDDTLDSRAGFATRFVRDGDRVACDLHLNDSYKDRAVVIETAVKTPELIGCSIDFKSSFEIKDGKAFMRVDELYAVDLVDEGAITHQGLFMGRGRVDNETKVERSPNNMSKTPPTAEDCMAAIDALSKSFKDELVALVAKMPSQQPPAETAAAVKELSTQLAAVKDEQAKFITEQKATIAKLAQERQSLGLSADKVKLLESMADETEKARLAEEEAKKKGAPKDYLTSVTELAAERKIKRSDAHAEVQRSNPQLYRAHLAAKGMIPQRQVA